ncbi:MAG: hypothetical protein LBT50_11150 [Prevotellaceae bacterium]|jgi:hypothetical protein|nr:hypothetical protein [Prevotellaceae bacterium]
MNKKQLNSSIMNRITLLIVFISLYSCLFAQQYKRVEGEIGLSLPFGIPKVYSKQSLEISPGAYLEIRFNIPNSHLSIGSQFYATSWIVKANDQKEKYHTYAMSTVFDYNFKEIKGFLLPFAGSGIGFGNLNNSSELFVSPRIGIECWNRVRFSFGYNLTSSSHSGFVCKLGFVIGGGKK